MYDKCNYRSLWVECVWVCVCPCVGGGSDSEICMRLKLIGDERILWIFMVSRWCSIHSLFVKQIGRAKWWCVTHSTYHPGWMCVLHTLCFIVYVVAICCHTGCLQNNRTKQYVFVCIWEILSMNFACSEWQLTECWMKLKSINSISCLLLFRCCWNVCIYYLQ